MPSYDSTLRAFGIAPTALIIERRTVDFRGRLELFRVRAVQRLAQANRLLALGDLLPQLLRDLVLCRPELLQQSDVNGMALLSPATAQEELAVRQAVYQEASDPALRFLALLRAAIRQRARRTIPVALRSSASPLLA